MGEKMSLATPPATTPSYPKELEIIEYYDPEGAEKLRKALDKILADPRLVDALSSVGVIDKHVFTLGAAVLLAYYTEYKGRKPRIQYEKFMKDYLEIPGTTHETYVIYKAEELYASRMARDMFARMLYEAGLSKSLEEARKIVAKYPSLIISYLKRPDEFVKDVKSVIITYISRSYGIKREDISVEIKDGIIKVQTPWFTITHIPQKIYPSHIADEIIDKIGEMGFLSYHGKLAVREDDKIVVLLTGEKLPIYKEIDFREKIDNVEIHVFSTDIRNDKIMITFEYPADKFRYHTIERLNPSSWRYLVLALASDRVPKKFAEKVLGLLVKHGIIPENELPGLRKDLEIGYKAGTKIRPAEPTQIRTGLIEAEITGFILEHPSPASYYAIRKYPDTIVSGDIAYIPKPVKDSFIARKMERLVVNYGGRKVHIPKKAYRILTRIKPDRVRIYVDTRHVLDIGGEKIYLGYMTHFEKHKRLYKIEHPLSRWEHEIYGW